MKQKSARCPHPKCGARMLRAYVRPVSQDHKQKIEAVGWWCPDCRQFTSDPAAGARQGRMQKGGCRGGGILSSNI